MASVALDRAESAEVLRRFGADTLIAVSKTVADELADVELYLLQIASIAGVDLELAILNKLQKNYTRTWDEDRQPNAKAE